MGKKAPQKRGRKDSVPPRGSSVCGESRHVSKERQPSGRTTAPPPTRRTSRRTNGSKTSPRPSRRGAQKNGGAKKDRSRRSSPKQSEEKDLPISTDDDEKMSLLPRGCADCITRGLTNKNQVLIHPKGTSIRITLPKQHLSLACPMQEHPPLRWCNMKNGSSTGKSPKQNYFILWSILLFNELRIASV
ncbi:hypothetical protein S83_011410 [Arachis hypogaea]